MTEDEAVTELQKIEWTEMSLNEAQVAAKEFMDCWDWQKKVPEYTRSVFKKTSVKAIAVFMWNATMKGLEHKQRKALGGLRYE